MVRYEYIKKIRIIHLFFITAKYKLHSGLKTEQFFFYESYLLREYPIFIFFRQTEKQTRIKEGQGARAPGPTIQRGSEKKKFWYEII